MYFVFDMFELCRNDSSTSISPEKGGLLLKEFSQTATCGTQKPVYCVVA